MGEGYACGSYFDWSTDPDSDSALDYVKPVSISTTQLYFDTECRRKWHLSGGLEPWFRES